MKVKLAPQRFQDDQENFDIIITFEEKVFDGVLQGANAVVSLTVPRAPVQGPVVFNSRPCIQFGG